VLAARSPGACGAGTGRLERATRPRTVKGLVAARAEVKLAAGAHAGGPLSLGIVAGRGATAPAATQPLVLLQTAGGLEGEDKHTGCPDS